MQPDALIAFLAARLDEDEAVAEARRGIFPSPGVEDSGAVWLHVKRGGNAVVVHYGHPVEGYGDMADLKAWAATDQGWTQDRVLGVVAALRLIAADCTKKLAYPANVPLYNLASRTLAGIAAIWDGHPDYDPEWRQADPFPPVPSLTSSTAASATAGACRPPRPSRTCGGTRSPQRPTRLSRAASRSGSSTRPP